MEKNKTVIDIVIGIVFIIMILSSIIGYNYSLNNKKSINDSEKIDEKDMFEKIDISNYPMVTCTNATMELAKSIKTNITEQYEDEVELDVKNNIKAYEKLKNDQADIIFVLDTDLDKKNENNDEFLYYKIAKEALIFVTNQTNKVSNLSIEQISDIYQGNYKKWSEVGGVDSNLVIYKRENDTIIQDCFQENVLKNKKITEVKEEYCIANTNELIKTISRYRYNTSAIGYCFNSRINKNDDIKKIAINGIMPNEESIKKEEYPLLLNYYMVMKKDKEQSNEVKKIIDFINSNNGKKIIEEAGYCPNKIEVE